MIVAPTEKRTQTTSSTNERIYMMRIPSGLIFSASVVATMTQCAFAMPTITIDSVTQRWPWNNKADITYTVSEGQNRDAGTFQKIVFTAKIDGKTYTIDGVHDVGASADTGTHTVTWTLPSGIKSSDCKMSAKLYTAERPSGDTFMVVDLDTGITSYEGAIGTTISASAGGSAWAATNYNVRAYKTDKMVFVKVFAGTWTTGRTQDFSAANSIKTWNTDLDYYIAMFPVTQYQYEKLMGANPSGCKTEIEGNDTALRPVENVSWTTLRGSATPVESLVPDATGTFLQRLNALTLRGGAGITGFDLPTEVMFEIAQRGGETRSHEWGADFNKTRCINNQNRVGASSMAVGYCRPNRIGLYDMTGNVWEWVLDDNSLANLANAPNPWTPAYSGETANRRLRGGNTWKEKQADWADPWKASYRFSAAASATGSSVYGFRVSRIVR